MKRIPYLIVGIFCGLISLLGIGAFFGGLALVGFAIWIQERMEDKDARPSDGLYPLP
jgi:hypothetical protein